MSLSKIRISRSTEENITGDARSFKYSSLDEVEFRLRSRFTKLVCRQMDHLRSLAMFPFVTKQSIQTTQHFYNGKSLVETTQKKEILDGNIEEILKELPDHLSRYKKEATYIDQKRNNCTVLDSFITKQLIEIKTSLMQVCSGDKAKELAHHIKNHHVNIETLKHILNWSNCLQQKPKFTDELKQVVSLILDDSSRSYETTSTLHGTNINNTDRRECLKNKDHAANLKNTGNAANSMNYGLHSKNTDLGDHSDITDHGVHSNNKSADNQCNSKPEKIHEKRIKGWKNKRYKRNINWNSRYKIGSKRFDFGNEQEQSNSELESEYKNKHDQESRKMKTDIQAMHAFLDRAMHKGNEQETQVKYKNGTVNEKYEQYATDQKSTYKKTNPENRPKAKGKRNGSKKNEGRSFENENENERNKETLWSEIRKARGLNKAEDNAKPKSELGTVQTVRNTMQSGKAKDEQDETETKSKPKFEPTSTGERFENKIKPEIKNEKEKTSNKITERIKSGLTEEINKKTNETKIKLNKMSPRMQERYEKEEELEFQSEANGNMFLKKLKTGELEEEGTQKTVYATEGNDREKTKNKNLFKEKQIENEKNMKKFKNQLENKTQGSHVNSDNKNTVLKFKIRSSKSDTAIIKRKRYKAGNLDQICKAKLWEQYSAKEQSNTCHTPEVNSSFKTIIRFLLFMFLTYLLIEIFCFNSISAPVIGEMSKFLDLRHVNVKPY